MPIFKGPDDASTWKVSALEALLVCGCRHGIGRHDGAGCQECLSLRRLPPCSLNQQDVIDEAVGKSGRERGQ
jgi:hypothetical protein